MATNFLKNLSSFGTPYVKPVGAAAKDPLVKMRASFQTRADDELKALKKTSKGKWFSKRADGTVIVGLRNGNALMNLDGGSTPFRMFESVADAGSFFVAARDACKEGELDSLLLASKRAPNKSKLAANPAEGLAGKTVLRKGTNAKSPAIRKAGKNTV